MATIILEGPDNSGKTTLAHALLGWLGPEVGHYIKSPAGRTKRWGDEWSNWNATQLNLSRSANQIRILDRTPEISELIYGPIVRNFTRLRDPLNSLLRLNQPDTFIIMTSTDKQYGLDHMDPMGNLIYRHKDEIAGAYNLITILMKYSGYNIAQWDYQTSHPKWLTNHILNKLEIPGIVDMKNSEFTRYGYKGKELVNGS